MLSRESWLRVWRELDAPGVDTDLFRRLTEAYAEPQRHYHTLNHLGECLEHFDNTRGLAARPAEIEAALWFHDAVYDVKAHDNEERSAALAREACLAAGTGEAVAERIHGLVMATRHAAEPTDPDARLLVDIDLAILGADPVRFDEYETQIRAEYAWVDAALFREKRREILEKFLARERLFNTAFFFERFEMRARENLGRSIGKLSS